MSMKYTIKEISAEEIQKILDFEENWALDKKGKDISPAKLSRTVAALANHKFSLNIMNLSVKPANSQNAAGQIKSTSLYLTRGILS